MIPKNLDSFEHFVGEIPDPFHNNPTIAGPAMCRDEQFATRSFDSYTPEV